MHDSELVALLGAALLMRLGQALYSAGIVRSKNAAGQVMRSLCDMALATLAFWAVGSAVLHQQANGVFGFSSTHLAGGGLASSVLGYLLLMLIGTGAFTAAVGERSRFAVPCAASLLLAGVVMAAAGQWVWRGGWLAEMGFHDLAGASVLHVSVGGAALAAAVLLGARSGKYNRDGSANFIPGHSLVMKQVGVLVMLVAWVPYVAGASILHPGGFISSAALNVLMAAAGGTAVSLLLGRLRYGKADVLLTSGGLLGGVVAISACAASVSSAWALGIGAVAGVMVPLATIYIDTRLKIDDPGSIAAIHGVGGAWGTCAAGIAMGVDWEDRVSLLAVQSLGAAAMFVMSAVVIGLVLLVMRQTIGIRVSEAHEFDGLDLAEHDVNAYPDFQQTTIKSYHLRET